MATVQTEERLHGLPAIAVLLKRFMPTSGALNEIAAIDGLRALAILLVLGIHLYLLGVSRGFNVGPAWLAYPAEMGFSGVYLFFILSGFLLFLPYSRSLLAGRPWPSARRFYLRRALRILPAYYAVLATLLLLEARPLLHIQYAGPLSLVALLFHDLNVNAFSIIFQLDSPFWTLAIEWQFYLLLPWIALALAKLAGPRANRWFFQRLALGLGAIVVLGLGIRCAAALVHYAGGQDYPMNAPGVVGIALTFLYGIRGKYLEIFALGMAASLIYVSAIEQGRLARGRAILLGTLALIAALAGLAGCTIWAAAIQLVPSGTGGSLKDWVFLPPNGASWTLLGEWALGLCFVLLLLGVLLGSPILRRLFSLFPLRYIGIISYSLYLWHLPILSLLVSSFTSYGRFVLFASVFLLLFCSASYYLIERPFIRYRRAAHSRVEQEPAPAAPSAQ